jgi:uncharacterized protein YukE
LMNKYEDMIMEIQAESRQFQEESKQLKENLAVIIAENNKLMEESSNGLSAAQFRNDYFAVADKIFTNLRNQIFHVSQVS